MRLLQVNYRGVSLTVEGEYHEGEERAFDYPGSGDEFEIYHIFAGEVDIYDIFSFGQLEQLTRICIEKITNN